MTREAAAEAAVLLYGGHPAAAALVVEAFDGATPERRERSWSALRHLETDSDLYPSCCSELRGVANAIADTLLAGIIYQSDARERRRAARLLTAVCREATRSADRRAA